MAQDQGVEGPKRTKIDIPSLTSEKDAFRERIVGQDEAINDFATLLAKLRSGIRQQRPGPIDIKFLAGPSGVGKTEMVYALADLLAEGKNNPSGKVIKLNGGEYQQEHMVSRLVGAPPGYRGSEDPSLPGFRNPALFSQDNLDKNKISYEDDAGRQRSVVFILVDEAEKAHEDIHKAFLGVLDKGQMVIGNNKPSDFSNTVIFYTSNVGNETVEQMRETGSVSREKAKEIVSEAFRNAFPPEFRGRIRDLIVFNNLDQAAIKKITSLKIKGVEEDLAANGIKIALELSPAALEWLIAQGYNLSEGARALQKVVDRYIHDKLVLAHVGIDINGKKIYVDIENGDPELSFYFNEGEQVPGVEASKPTVVKRVSQTKVTQVKVVDQHPTLPQDTARTQPTVQPTVEAKIVEELPKLGIEGKEGIPQLPAKIQKELLEKLSGIGVKYYVEDRDKLVRLGLLDPEIANGQRAIKVAAAKRIFDHITGNLDYLDEIGQVIRAGLLSAQEISSSLLLKEAIKTELRKKLGYGADSFKKEVDKLVKAGIGTEDEWKQVFYESQ